MVERLGVIAFNVVATMGVMLFVWLIMGKRQLGEMTAFDFAVAITAGTVAGVGIIDPHIEFGRILAALGLIGMTQVAINWLFLKYRDVYINLISEPTVLVEDGQIIKDNLRKVRFTLEMLLQLLRGKDVFDITEVELAVLETTGRLSVLKKAEFLPLKPIQVNVSVAANSILHPVIMEGKLQEKALRALGCSKAQIEALRRQYQDRLDEVFIAFMDKDRRIHVIKNSVNDKKTVIH